MRGVSPTHLPQFTQIPESVIVAKAKTPTKKTTSAKAAVKSAATKATKSKPGEQEVVMDRRRTDRRTKPAKTAEEAKVEKKDVPAAEPKMERRAKVNRRRQIDPTTCERDYSGDEIEFMQALDAYKRSSGRMFPTCSEILEVIRDLGYQKPGHLMPEAAEATEESPTTPAFSDEVPAIEATV